jgi:hypothetical protein
LGELEAGGQKKKDITRSQKQEGRSGNQEKMLEPKGQKQEGRSERAKVSERAEQELEGKLLPFSRFFFFCFLACFFSLVFEKKTTGVLHHYLFMWCYNEKDNNSLMSLPSSLC